MKRKQNFPHGTKLKALERQQSLCAMCGTTIFQLGQEGKKRHKYGEIAHAHHIVPIKYGGNNDTHNCIILCEACHYIAHEGGNYRHGTVIGTISDFEHFYGKV